MTLISELTKGNNESFREYVCSPYRVLTSEMRRSSTPHYIDSTVRLFNSWYFLGRVEKIL